jgi:hypothetical protein
MCPEGFQRPPINFPEAPRRPPEATGKLPGNTKKAQGQDLAKNGRFPMIPEETFNSQRRGRQIAEICSYRLPEVPGSSPRLPQSSPPEAPRSFERLLEASGKLASESSQKFPEACRSSQKLSEGSKKAPRGSPEGAGSVGKLPQAAKSSPMLSEASDAPERFLERSQRFPESFPTGKKKGL